MSTSPKQRILQNGFGNMLFTLVEHVAEGGELYSFPKVREHIEMFFKETGCKFLEEDEIKKLNLENDFFISREVAEKLPKEKIKSLLNKAKAANTTSYKHVCHLRFGDYMSKWPYCEVKPSKIYIEDAAKALGISIEDITFVTDTPNFAKLILGPNIHIAESDSPLEDMWTIINATESVIMSPSTFSFWGAYLSNAKRVIFPKTWAENILHNGKRVYPLTFAAGTELLPNEARYTVIDNMRPLKVAIVSINLGIYSALWDDFYRSAKRNLAVDCQRRFIVVTDNQDIRVDDEDLIVSHKTDKKWPDIMLEKESVLYRLFKEYEDCDYVVYFNSNCIFTKPIYGRDLGFDASEPLLCARHPGVVLPKQIEESVESDKRSVACFTDTPSMYFMGGFMGGKPRPFAIAMNEILKMEKTDKESGFGLPKWHDESYWNRLVWNHPSLFKILPNTLTSYYPSAKPVNFAEREERIILRRKEDILGENFREKLK